MKIGIYTNLLKDSYKHSSKKVIDYLTKQNIKYRFLNEEYNFDGLDYVIILGGDGTLLSISKDIAKSNLPVLCINTGTLGFLTEYEDNEIEEAIELLKSQDFVIDTREFLEASCGENNINALNEIVISRQYSENSVNVIIRFEVYANEKLVDKYVADGIIVSTPTGSTAYSLSAGGSILTPDLNGFILTPVAPHSLQSRPIVVSNNTEIKIVIKSVQCSQGLFADGKHVTSLKSDDVIIVKKSNLKINFIRKKDFNFFNRLQYKFSKWNETK